MGEVSISCPFETRRDEDGKPTEKIDGVVELDTNLYLVEMRWEDLPVSPADIQAHMEMLRTDEEGCATRGVFISFSGYTELAILAAKEACATGNLVILCTVADMTHVLEGEGHLDAFLRTRIHIASFDKNPYASYC